MLQNNHCRVLQGSIIFTIAYINDITNLTQSVPRLFVDDTCLIFLNNNSLKQSCKNSKRKFSRWCHQILS